MCVCVLTTRLFDVKADLGVLHHTLNAVKVGEVTDGLIGVVQHSSDSLSDECTDSVKDYLRIILRLFTFTEHPCNNPYSVFGHDTDGLWSINPN